MNEKIKRVAILAVLLALCVVAQLFKNIQFITGPLVNTVIIIAGLYLGLVGGIVIAVLSPVFAYLIAPSPMFQALPQMMPVVMIGNLVIVLTVYFLRKHLIIGLASGAVLKALVLWILTWFVVLPLFGSSLSPSMVTVIQTAFSINQLITAAIGCLIVYPLWQILEKYKKVKEN